MHVTVHYVCNPEFFLIFVSLTNRRGALFTKNNGPLVGCKGNKNVKKIRWTGLMYSDVPDFFQIFSSVIFLGTKFFLKSALWRVVAETKIRKKLGRQLSSETVFRFLGANG
jgi:hypothetical protein